jgi:hypothetical protein
MTKEKQMSVRRDVPRWCVALLLIGSAFAFSRIASAQSFPADKPPLAGTDGALDLSSSTGIVDFDPVARGIDTDRDNVFHFTSVKIPSGVTLKVSGKKVTGPMYWLVTGTVVIDGILALDGEVGHFASIATADRRPGVPGPGGHPGGVGGVFLTQTTFQFQPQAGSGPGGGAAGPWGSWNGSTGAATVNKFMVPLVGGSGGGGGVNSSGNLFGSGGGGGGGAILIASSISIHVGGSISAWGGDGGRYSSGACSGIDGGGGSGGSIRLAAPTLTGGGLVEAGPGFHCVFGRGQTGKGWVRLEAFHHESTYRIRPEFTNVTVGSPVSSYAPTRPPPAIWVDTIDGRTIPRNPTGSFDVPDLGAGDPIFSKTVAVPVVIKATNVPLSTTMTKVTLYLVSAEAPFDQIITHPVIPAPTGNSSAWMVTADVKFPPGYTRGYVKVTW